jgi:hypothetical protein
MGYNPHEHVCKCLFVKRFKNLPVIKFTSKPYTNGDKILSVV